MARELITSNADFGGGVTIYPMIRPAEVADAEYELYKLFAAEYIGGERGHIGDIDLSGYVKKTDYASLDNYGLVRGATSSGTDYGIFISGGVMSVVPVTEAQVDGEEGERIPLTVNRISRMMSNYGITSKILINAVKSAVIESLNGGTKNLVEFKDGTHKAGGITYTVKDGIIKASGSTASTRDVELTLSKGTYVLSGCPSGGSDSGYRLYVATKSGGAVLSRDAGSPHKFEINSDTAVLVRIRIAQNYTLPENIEFKPMLCRKEI